MSRKRWIAGFMSAALLMGALSGCSSADDSTETGVDGLVEKTKGSYVEEDLEVPTEWADWITKQIFTSEDKIHVVLTKEEQERLNVQEWEYSEGAFSEVTGDWLSTIELPAQAWMELQLLEDGNGAEYLFASYVDEGEDSYRSYLWKNDGGTAKEITPEKWKTLMEDWDMYESVRGIAALDDGRIAAYGFTSFDFVSGEDGSIVESLEDTNFNYESVVLSDGENIYRPTMNQTSGAIDAIEKWKGGKSSDVEKISIELGNSSTMQFCVAEDGALYMAGGEGIYRCAAGSLKWEKMLSGLETSFSISTCWSTGMAALTDGTVYAAFTDENESISLKKYWYDPEAVNEVTEVLKLYAVEESYLLQNAAALYHRAHPEVLIEIESAYSIDDKYSGIEMDYNAVYQQLNTMLMGDSAPDILVLDHLNVDAYAEKGLLVDLQEMMVPLEESGEVLANITSTYIQENGNRYMVPMQFGFNVAMGRDITAKDMESLESLANFLQGKSESYMGEQTVVELVDKFYPYFCGEIVKDSQLDKETLAEKLGYLKTIADNAGVVEKNGEYGGYNEWDLASYVKLAFAEGEGFNGIMFEMAIVNYIKGDFTAFENSFIPSCQMAVSSQSSYQDTAKDFIRFALSEEVQGTDYYTGFPVNTASLEAIAAKDRSDMGAYTTIIGDDGSEVEFEIDAYSNEITGRLVTLCKELDHPVKEDSKIREVLIDALSGYLLGGQTLDATIAQIEGDLAMYLAE